MTRSKLAASLLALAFSGTCAAGPVITAVYTTYSETGVPTAINITGTDLCASSKCTIKPTVKLGGNTLSGVSGTSSTGIAASLGLIGDGDYLLTVTAGSSTGTFPLTVRAKVTASAGGASVRVGTTSTLPSTSPAIVTNSGSTPAAILNFGIP